MEKDQKGQCSFPAEEGRSGWIRISKAGNVVLTLVKSMRKQNLEKVSLGLFEYKLSGEDFLQRRALRKPENPGPHEKMNKSLNRIKEAGRKLNGRTALKAVLEIEGMALPSQEKKLDYIETKTCPRCNSENEADATYCSKCSLVLDERVLITKRQEEKETDALMDQLIQHPLVQQAIKEAVKQLWTQRKIQETAPT